MEFLIFMFWIGVIGVIVVGVLLAVNVVQVGTMKAKTAANAGVDAVLNAIRDVISSIRKFFSDIGDSLYKHRKWVYAGAGVATGAGVLYYTMTASMLGSPAVLAPTALEIEATVASSWSAAGTGARVSSGIALTTAAARGEADGVTWQNWVAIAGTKQVVQRMQPNAPYQFTLALTPGEVRLAGARRTVASAAAQQAVRDTLLTQNQVELRAVLLADPDRLSLQAGESPEKTLVIDVPRLLGDRRTTQIPTDSVDAVIERAFGSVSYGVQAGATQGWLQASVLLMANNRGLDQIVTTHCIGECEGPQPDGRVSGPPRLLALMQKAESADISLFLTDLKQGWVHGVLISATPVDGKTMWMWNTNYTTDVSFANALETAFRDTYNDLDSRDQLLKKGESLARLVFAGTDPGLTAKAVLNQLVQQSEREQFPGGQGLKSLFFHFEFIGKEGIPMVLPIGLMTVTNSAGAPDFAGRHLMIEQPMLKQPSYGASAQCTANWQVLMSETVRDDDPLYLASEAMRQLNASWPGPERFTHHKTIGDFQDWLASGSTREPTIVTTLSHHADNKLFFGDGEFLPSSDVLRRFGESSIAILDGCGTGKPGAMDFVARFNVNGIHTAIVSAYDVNPAVAGAYLGCLRQQIGRGTTTIAQAHFHAVNSCTWPDDQAPATSTDPNPPRLLAETYAANALKYVFLGNAATTVCQ